MVTLYSLGINRFLLPNIPEGNSKGFNKGKVYMHPQTYTAILFKKLYLDISISAQERLVPLK